jgi:hypothetical protein
MERFRRAKLGDVARILARCSGPSKIARLLSREPSRDVCRIPFSMFVEFRTPLVLIPLLDVATILFRQRS